MEELKVKPINEPGSPIEINGGFGGKDEYVDAIKDLENELYKSA